ncbi:streptophobe family protein [Streptomyces cirratus]|uniref:streptophobe family protein n=1 Tax=Streptomyces cirratus TaxID=68187 RepID=UPI00167C8A2C|nr:streptophobe family protein [Streptomyces cirratus]
MSSPSTTPASRAAKAWRDGFFAVVAGFAVMFAVAAAGAACAGAGSLPGGAFPRVVAAVAVMAAGGSVEPSGGAGALAGAAGQLSVMPLSVSLAGALTVGCAFLRPLRGRAVAGPRELLGRAVPLVVLWLLALMGTGLAARQTFGLLPGDSPLGTIGELLDSAPTVGFETDLPVTALCGLLWIVGLLVVALLVSRRAPLPASVVRFHTAVRPAAFATLVLLLAYVVLGFFTAVVVACTQGHAERTLAVVLLGLPNLAWLALSLGLGGAWEGRVEGPFGLPMPRLLDQVLRGPERSTVDVSTLAERDSRAWWLVVVAAVLLLLGTGVLAAVRSPAGVRPWRQALHLGVALALAMLTVCLLTGTHAGFGLSLLGIGDVSGLGEEVELTPVLWRNTGLALLWGAVAGFLGTLLARPLRHRGPVTSKDPTGL